MASEFEGIGLRPAGEKGMYFQTVPFRPGHVDEVKTSLTLAGNGKEDQLVFRENYITFAKSCRIARAGVEPAP